MIVVQLDDIGAVALLPMSHESTVLTVVMADVQQIGRVAGAEVQMQKINRQAIVEGLARGVNDLGVRK